MRLRLRTARPSRQNSEFSDGKRQRRFYLFLATGSSPSSAVRRKAPGRTADPTRKERKTKTRNRDAKKEKANDERGDAKKNQAGTPTEVGGERPAAAAAAPGAVQFRADFPLERKSHGICIEKGEIYFSKLCWPFARRVTAQRGKQYRDARGLVVERRWDAVAARGV